MMRLAELRDRDEGRAAARTRILARTDRAPSTALTAMPSSVIYSAHYQQVGDGQGVCDAETEFTPSAEAVRQQITIHPTGMPARTATGTGTASFGQAENGERILAQGRDRV